MVYFVQKQSTFIHSTCSQKCSVPISIQAPGGASSHMGHTSKPKQKSIMWLKVWGSDLRAIIAKLVVVHASHVTAVDKHIIVGHHKVSLVHRTAVKQVFKTSSGHTAVVTSPTLRTMKSDPWIEWNISYQAARKLEGALILLFSNPNIQ